MAPPTTLLLTRSFRVITRLPGGSLACRLEARILSDQPRMAISVDPICWATRSSGLGITVWMTTAVVARAATGRATMATIKALRQRARRAWRHAIRAAARKPERLIDRRDPGAANRAR